MKGFSQSHWFSDEHAAFADVVERFYTTEVGANASRWYDQGFVDRDFWRKAGDIGILGVAVDAAFGGSGLQRSFEAVALQGYAATGDTSWGYTIQSIVCHYLMTYGSQLQKERWLPKLVTGEMVSAIAMTEATGGSDLKSIRTRATRDGDHYLVNGSKTFITNGLTADLVCLVAKTDMEAAGVKGISLLFVETEKLVGFERGAAIQKIGMHGQDTAELFFSDARVPAEFLLGEVEGRGFYQLMEQLAWERLLVGVMALGAIDHALAETLRYTQQRQAFGSRLFDFQNTRFKLAEVATKGEILRSFVADCVSKADKGALDSATASMVKWWSSQAQCEVVDDCLQLFGGYGFTKEYSIGRQYADARVQKIYGGTNEIMKELIARELDRG